MNNINLLLILKYFIKVAFQKLSYCLPLSSGQTGNDFYRIFWTRTLLGSWYLYYLRLTMNKRRHQPWDIFNNSVDLAVKLWFYELYA